MKKLFIFFLCGLLGTGTVFSQKSGVDGTISWEIVDDVLIVSGEGVIPDHQYVSVPGPGVNSPWWALWGNSITKIVVCEGITSIGEYAFAYLDQLTSVSIPASVMNIGYYAFANCTSLSEVVNACPIPQDGDIPTVFSGAGIGGCRLLVPAASVELYRSTTAWDNFLILGIYETESLTWLVHDGVLIIRGFGDMPEYDVDHPAPWLEQMELITSIDIGYGVTNISAYAFRNLYYAASVSISETVTSIGYGAFYNCISLASVTFPNSLTYIGYAAFRNCTGLTSVTFPNSLNTLEVEAFWGCHGLTTVTIPPSVTGINNTAFLNCSGLFEINVDVNNNAYTSIDGVLFTKDETLLLIYPCGRPNSHYDVPSTVTFVGHNAFVLCKGLHSITFPVSTTNIGSCTFLGCINLSSLIIPSSVIDIGFSAFEGCSGLTSVTIPSSVTSIGGRAFAGCDQLSEIVNGNSTPQILSDESNKVFSTEIYNTCLLWVPVASVNAYQTATEWKEFKNISAGITLDKEQLYLLPGATDVITATIHTDLIDNTFAVWYHDNIFVVTSSNHTITTATAIGISPGTAHISVFIGGIMDAICTITVVEEGASSIEGTVYYEGDELITVYLYMKESENMGQKSLTKGSKPIGGYVLLAKTTPKANGQYSFENLPPGEYMVDVEIHEYTSDPSPELKISGGEIRSGVDFTANNSTHLINFDLPTGTNELSDAGLNIYPNPFYDLLHIENAEGCTLRIFTVDGRQVHVQTVTGADQIIHLEHLPVGLYIIRIENNRRSTVFKAVKL